ncbi:oxygenase MpaB family protein [Sanguibacter suaedae]|nr:oxygenase MpaB family protein [Sanguibacter suaedae]
MTPAHSLRQRLSDGLFSMVAGPEGPAARERIHTTPGERWHAPGSPIHRVHGDASMYVGGIRALLLQSLHPLAMAGVDDFSDFRQDVWGRLARTSTFLADTTFGTVEHAERAVEIVRAVHRRISGTAPDGRPYRADDPHLLTWVHVAEVDSFLTAHQKFGARPLTDAECDTYVEQSSGVALRLGAEDVPTTRAGLAAALEAFRPELESTPAARDVARFLLRDAPLPWVAKPPYAVLCRGAVATLPRWAREPLRLKDSPRLDRTLGRAAGQASTRALRWLNDAQPAPTVTPHL